MKKKCIVGLAWPLVFLLSASPLFSDTELSYDPYEPAFRHPRSLTEEAAKKRDRNQILLRLLEQPLRPVGYAIGEMAAWTERHYIDRKTEWFFDKMLEIGILPQFDSPEGSGGIRLGARVELDKLLKMNTPNFKAETFGGWTYHADSSKAQSYDFGGKYRVGMPFDPSIYHEGFIRYNRRASENFFGLGNRTSLGDWATYKTEELKIEEKLGFMLMNRVSADTSVIFQHVKIGNGRRKRVGKLKERYPEIPGVNGATLMGIRGGLAHDSRDHLDDPKRGGKAAFDFGYFFDVGGSDFHYLNMQATVSRFFSLWSDRRVLAVRIQAEKNESLGGGNDIPFFNMARLGGAEPGAASDLLRAYRFNRFFDKGSILANIEYRYNIWEYGSFAGDAFGLFDIGEVFKEVSNFALKRLRMSYGGGLNLKFRRKAILSLTAAGGDEGWRFAAHTGKSF